MKESYACDVCGKTFCDRNECLKHEESCNATDELRRRVKSLEDKVDLLEAKLNALNPRNISISEPSSYYTVVDGCPSIFTTSKVVR